MELILKVEKGRDAGKRLRLPSGGALVGSSMDADLVLQSAKVSREHARLTPQGGGYVIENLSGHGTAVNGSPIRKPTPLKIGDRIDLAEDARLIVETPDGSGGTLTRRLLAVAALGAIVVIALVFVLPGTPAEGRRSADWNQAYLAVSAWMDQAVRDGRLPAPFAERLEDADRLERNAMWSRAAEVYGRLNLLLSPRPVDPRVQGGPTFAEAAARHHDALEGLLTGRAGASADDRRLAAALLEYIRRSYSYTHRRANP